MEQDGSNPIRINCVILNFNDGETVTRLVHMIHDYDYLEKIVLVDNHSTDDSWEQLQVLKDEKGSATPLNTTEPPMCWWQTRT